MLTAKQCEGIEHVAPRDNTNAMPRVRNVRAGVDRPSQSPARTSAPSRYVCECHTYRADGTLKGRDYIVFIDKAERDAYIGDATRYPRVHRCAITTRDFDAQMEGKTYGLKPFKPRGCDSTAFAVKVA